MVSESAVRVRAPGLRDSSVRPEVIAFCGCLAVVAALGALGRPEVWLGAAALAAVAVAASRHAGAVHALAVTGIAWLFDDGFVADSARTGFVPGVLHWRGASDVVVIALLLVLCLLASRRPTGDTCNG